MLAFAAMEARLNRAVIRNLANASAVLGGVAVIGIFDKAYQVGDVGGSGFATSQPMFSLLSSSVPFNVTGLPMVIGSVTYTVVVSEPDGTGMTQLLLEKA